MKAMWRCIKVAVLKRLYPLWPLAFYLCQHFLSTLYFSFFSSYLSAFPSLLYLSPSHMPLLPFHFCTSFHFFSFLSLWYFALLLTSLFFQYFTIHLSEVRFLLRCCNFFGSSLLTSIIPSLISLFIQPASLVIFLIYALIHFPFLLFIHNLSITFSISCNSFLVLTFINFSFCSHCHSLLLVSHINTQSNWVKISLCTFCLCISCNFPLSQPLE